MRAIEAWIDLFAASLARGLNRSGPAVVLHEAQRFMPMLERSIACAWIHPGTPPFQDFSRLPNQLPRLRERIDLQRSPASALDLLRRASLRLVALPTALLDGAALLDAAAALARPSDRQWLVYGATDAPHWPAAEPLRLAGELQTLQAPGLRLLASPELAGQLQALGLADSLRSAGSMGRLVARLAVGLGATAKLNTPSGRPRLSMHIEPLSCIATVAETVTHHVLSSGRALFNARGMASLVLPWDGGVGVQFLIRNLRGRIDDARYTVGDDSLAATQNDFIEQGAVVRLRLPAIAPGRGAVLQLALPVAAWPESGFADMAALQFAVDLE